MGETWVREYHCWTGALRHRVRTLAETPWHSTLLSKNVVNGEAIGPKKEEDIQRGEP